MVAAVTRRRDIGRITSLALAALCAAALTLAGCGGSGERQDANEPSGTWKVAVEEFEFPTTQRLGARYRLEMFVRNVDDRDLPNLTVSFTGLDYQVTQGESASPTRPVWVRDRETPNSLTANKDTYSFGAVKAGQSARFWIDLTAVRRGRHLLTYTVDAGLYGKASATLEDGTPATGQVEVAIDPSVDIEKDTLN